MSKAETMLSTVVLPGEEDSKSTGDRNEGDARVRSKEERRVVLKQDLVILPLLALSFFFAYLVSAINPSGSNRPLLSRDLTVFFRSRIAVKLEMLECSGCRKIWVFPASNSSTVS